MTQNENLNTAQLLESTKINKPLVYKVLLHYDALDNNTKPELMSEMIYAIELALWGDKEYAEVVVGSGGGRDFFYDTVGREHIIAPYQKVLDILQLI